MTNEIIFQHSSSGRGRWGDLKTTKITILADFSDMAKWPYQIKVEELVEYSLDEEDNGASVTFHAISKNLFDSIKSAIAAHTELTELPEHIHYVSVRDGTDDSFTFICPAFQKTICGASLLSIGYDELEEDPQSRRHCAVLYRAYEQIRGLVNAERPDTL